MSRIDDPNKRPIEHHRFFVWTGKLIGLWGRCIADMDLADPFELPDEGPILFAGNHRSFFDFVMTMAIFSREGLSCRILVQARLFKNPMMRWVLGRWRCIPTSSKVREAAEDAAAEALESGQMVAIMPEGRLLTSDDRDGKVGEGRPGVVHLARRTGAVVVPVGFSNTDAAWSVGTPPRPRVRNRPMTRLRVGPDHLVGDGSPIDEAQRVMAAIAEQVD